MTQIRVPVWSFLAVEPAVKIAVKKSPDAFGDFISAKNSAHRARAFWKLFASIEKHVAQRMPIAIVDRHRLAIQAYYALIDLSELNEAADRDVQRWLDVIMRNDSVTQPTAAVHISGTATVA